MKKLLIHTRQVALATIAAATVMVGAPLHAQEKGEGVERPAPAERRSLRGAEARQRGASEGELPVKPGARAEDGKAVKPGARPEAGADNARTLRNARGRSLEELREERTKRGEPGTPARPNIRRPVQVDGARAPIDVDALRERVRATRAKRVRDVRVQKEREKHLRRIARIDRVKELGVEKSDAKLVERAEALRDKEVRRHERKMEVLRKAIADETARAAESGAEPAAANPAAANPAAAEPAAAENR